MRVGKKIQNAINNGDTILYLSGMGLKKIHSEVWKVTNLTELDLSENQLTDVPVEIGNLVNLTYLNLRGNKLTSVPVEIGKLVNLTKLDLRGNQLTSVPAEIGKLVKLTELYLWNNQLTSVPVEIGNLVNLIWLDLSGNKLTSVPDEIGNLVKLTGLGLGINQLTSIPTKIGKLVNLTELYLPGNQLTSIPAEIGKLGNLTRLFLKENPLQTPPLEIANKGIQAIREYFETVEVSEAENLYEAKLLIVGAGKVGKTCLRKKIMDNDYNILSEEQSTEGVDIDHWVLAKNPLDPEKDFTAHIWDFGGQEVYHATHQFFLTKRSLYIFVWEARKEEGTLNFEYWLNVIKLLSGSSPVIIVMNKYDERSIEIDRASYKEKYPNIIKFFEISCLKGTNIGELTQFIEDTIVTLPLVGTDWPGVWTDIRKRLESDKRNYIDHTEYLKICREFGIDEEKADVLSSFLHDLGIILHYREDPILQNIIILKPEWGTAAVYRVLDTRAVKENRGRFHYRDLHEIWKDTTYPPEKHRELLALMEKFELCFNLIDTQEYIIPELLSGERPDYEWFADNNLRFEYHYEFLPEGIITRFIVRNHRLIEKNYYWKHGVILHREGARARVVQEKLNRKIRIAIAGKNKKDLLAIIRKEFDHIHATLNNPEMKEMVQCNCKECLESETPHFHDYSVLRKFIEKREETIQCTESAEKVPVRALLGEFITEEEYDNIIHGRGRFGKYDDRHEEERLKGHKEEPQENNNHPEKKSLLKSIQSFLQSIHWFIWILVGITVLYAFLSDRVFNNFDKSETEQTQVGEVENKNPENIIPPPDSVSVSEDSADSGR